MRPGLKGFSIRRAVGATAFSAALNSAVFTQVFGPMLTKKPDDVVEMTFEDPADHPDTPDTPDREDPRVEPPPPIPPPTPKPKVEPKPKDKVKDKLAQATPPPPTPPPPVPPPPVPPPPPPPQPQPNKEKLKSVEQDQFPEEDENNQARYLAEKNHKVKEDTRSDSTNLVKRSAGEATPTEKSDNRDDKVGGKDDKIAELQDHEGKPGINPDSAQSGKEQAPETNEKPRAGALSMRNLMPSAEEKKKDKREGVELDDPEKGDLARARQGEDRKRAQALRRGTDLRMKLDSEGLDRIVGYDIASEQRKRGAMTERSMPKGRYDRYLTKVTAMRSAIENFLPEVKPGNQQELGTRRSPFAAYIAAMHRMIHKHWTFGFLTQLESNMGASKQYEDLTLWVQLEIVLKSDGAVDKVTIVRTSGNLPFDTAAIDSVLSSAPFPTPPPVIRSPNGKTYLDWKFHRDERACGTYGVDPHILTTPGENTEHDTTPIPKAATQRPE